jgi:hypothetical protein
MGRIGRVFDAVFDVLPGLLLMCLMAAPAPFVVTFDYL